MEIPKIYIETTIFNILYEPDLPQYLQNKEDSRKLFNMIKAGRFDPYTSVYVIRELENNPNLENRDKMLRMISEYKIKSIPESDEAERLTAIYIADKVVSPAFPTDALHIAMTTVNGLDFIVSLNFTHIVRDWTIKKVKKINDRERYKQIGIYKPSEVLEF
jgi:hypothetical protein